MTNSRYSWITEDLLRSSVDRARAQNYAEGNEAYKPRLNPMFKLAVGYEPIDEGNALALGPISSP